MGIDWRNVFIGGAGRLEVVYYAAQRVGGGRVGLIDPIFAGVTTNNPFTENFISSTD